MVTRHAVCACGRLGAICVGEPAKVSLCHCRECQRRTGSTYGIAAFFPRAAVETQGRARHFTRQSDSGFTVTFHFCRDCGSTIFWEPARRPDLIGVAVGAFADPGFPPPTQAVHAESRHPWVAFHGLSDET